jgi:hypothetical protein
MQMKNPFRFNFPVSALVGVRHYKNEGALITIQKKAGENANAEEILG